MDYIINLMYLVTFYNEEGAMIHQLREIQTKRLILKPMDREVDLFSYAQIMSEDEVGRWLPKGRGYTLDETISFMTYMEGHWIKYTYGIWGVYSKESQTLLGHCGLNFIEDLQKVEVLYAFGQNGRGKGYATEAGAQVLNTAFDQLHLQEVIALAKPENNRSRRVIEKLGLLYQQDIQMWNMDLVYYSLHSNQRNKG